MFASPLGKPHMRAGKEERGPLGWCQTCFTGNEQLQLCLGLRHRREGDLCFQRPPFPCTRNALCGGIRGFTRSLCCSNPAAWGGCPCRDGPLAGAAAPAVLQDWACCSVILLSGSSWQMPPPCTQICSKTSRKNCW